MGEPNEFEEEIAGITEISELEDVDLDKLEEEWGVFEKESIERKQLGTEEFSEKWEKFFSTRAPSERPGEPEEEEEDLARITEISEVIEENELEIFKYENIVGVGPGFIVSAGEPTRDIGLVVLVEKKVPKEKLLAKDIIPEEIKGTKTDVIEVGRIEALKYKGRYRPAFPGCSIGHYRITAGTFGCMVQDKRTHEFKILSNNHVLANVNASRKGDPILQQGRYDGGRYPKAMIARLEKFVPLSASTLNLVDAAVAKPINLRYVIPAIPRIGIPRGTAQARLGSWVYKVGRTTQFTSGRVIATNFIARVGYGRITLLFKNQIVTTRMGAPGDSGSLLVDPGRRAVGLLFAGSSKITLHNHITNVLMGLGVEIVEAL